MYALVGLLGQRGLALGSLPHLIGRGHELASCAAVDLAVLLLCSTMQRLALAVLGLHERTVDDNQRVARMHGIALAHEQRVDAPEELATDAYLCGLDLPLQGDGGLARCEQPDEGDDHDCGEQNDEGEGKGFATHLSVKRVEG